MYVTDDPKEFYDLTPSEQEQLCAWIKLNFYPQNLLNILKIHTLFTASLKEPPAGFISAMELSSRRCCCAVSEPITNR